MARKKKIVEPVFDDADDRPRRGIAAPLIRSDESPNRVVWPRKINRPRPGDKIGYRPIVL